jgi:hypothetical protein
MKIDSYSPFYRRQSSLVEQRSSHVKGGVLGLLLPTRGLPILLPGVLFLADLGFDRIYCHVYVPQVGFGFSPDRLLVLFPPVLIISDIAFYSFSDGDILQGGLGRSDLLFRLLLLPIERATKGNCTEPLRTTTKYNCRDIGDNHASSMCHLLTWFVRVRT